MASPKIVSATDGRRHWEIFRGETADGGATWAWTPVTANSRVDNLRPIVPHGDGEHRALLWLRGKYTTFNNYDLDAVALVFDATDFNADGEVDGEDLSAFTGCDHGRSAADLDRDGDVDEMDLRRFAAEFARGNSRRAFRTRCR